MVKLNGQLYEYECVKLSLFIGYENLPSHFPVTKKMETSHTCFAS